ncbi:hypothetical protein GCM10009841_01140 [Microlunatus panaciterrae]|uniref:8-oxo-dGTP pyrophosphatase MutT (NUDIX family) n=1 Tax=Microlunatus panaciterrae TaxID=400768 RepID=A0ABS2RJL1_9ACTN|nr:NUDIX domain-containing protein [Microlunatus panaciterrae]MBM7799196.1 8-oxo-dGTP pyrophosphatase MutT (NUDIX family) [Microlunatus panaciterrae]
MGSHSWEVLSRLPVEVPDALARRAEAWSPDSVAATPALSASVILVRDGIEGIETYLLHRHARMPFAAGMVVFPGGRVDPADDSDGRDPVRACALRETTEETGVQLGDHHLQPWAHWITPEMEPRRYDTHFFLAAMPPFQTARDISGETDRALWARPADALRQAADSVIALMPPTLSILLELADVGSVKGALSLAAERRVDVVLPVLTRAGRRWVFSYPGGVDRA